jgi:tRNA1Val (adenine37-N6)-methyltransferase
VRHPFKFKQFALTDGRSALKLSTDAVLLGAFAGLPNPGNVLDIGTGSGIVALMVAQRCDAEITGIDIDKGSVEDARFNFSASPWSSRLCAVHQSLQEFSSGYGKKFDAIVCNPPFFKNSSLSPFPSRNLSKHNGQLPFTGLIAQVKNLLNQGGSCSFIVPATEEKHFCSIACEMSFSLFRKKWVLPKKSKKANRVLLEFRLSEVAPEEETELIIRDENNNFTADYKKFTRDFYLNF